MIRSVADTQAIVWYLQASRQLSNAARRVFEEAIADGDRIAISAMSIIEMIFLAERGRIALTALENLSEALDAQAATLIVVPIDRSIAERVGDVSRAAVPELPDRVIAATALHLDVPLITSDLRIRTSGIATVW